MNFIYNTTAKYVCFVGPHDPPVSETIIVDEHNEQDGMFLRVCSYRNKHVVICNKAIKAKLKPFYNVSSLMSYNREIQLLHLFSMRIH